MINVCANKCDGKLHVVSLCRRRRRHHYTTTVTRIVCVRKRERAQHVTERAKETERETENN